MGLVDLSAEELKDLQKMLKLLSVFGITEENLRELSSILNNKENTLTHAREEKDKEIVEKNEKNMVGKHTFEEYVSMFTGDIEEFYPDGKQ